MGRSGIRSDLSRKSANTKSSAVDPSVSVERVENRARWPELRIVRETNIEWPGYENWDRYLNVLGRLNRGIGQVACLGSMALNHVNAQEMGKMLEKKYPKPYEQRRATIQLHRRFAENFNMFVQREERTGIEMLHVTQEHARFLDDSDDIDAIMARLERNQDDSKYDILLETEQQPSGLDWGIGMFAVRSGMEKFSRNALALDLTVNDQLYAERDEIISYLRDEGLDTRIIDRAREPHLTVLGTFGIAGSVEVKHTNHPEFITLDPPRGLAINNSPPN